MTDSPLLVAGPARARLPSPAELRAWGELTALALLVSLALWLGFGRWIGTPATPMPSVVFVTASARLLAGLVTANLVVLGRLARRARDVPGQSAAAPILALRGSLRPLWLVATTLVPYARLLVEHAPVLGPLCHFTYDLRLWIGATAIGWCLARGWHITGPSDLADRIDRAFERIPSWIPRPRLAWIVFAVTLLGIAAGSQLTRFQGLVAGDEPKYIRFCEVLLQTQGFDVEKVRLYGRMGFGDVSWLGFPRALASTIGDEVPAMLRDLGAILRGAAPPTFNRATHHDGWFIRGKDGGTYQVHLPGFSFLLLVPYAIDRLWLSEFGGIELGVPNSLYVTSTAVALLFACWVTALYRLLRDTTRMPRLSAAVALATGLTIPLFPFHGQYYPEVAAGLVLMVLVRHLELGTPATLGSAAWLGLLAGYLPWLHNRFALPSLFLVGWFVVRHPRGIGVLMAFLGIYATSLALQALYYYRITGSILPTSMWAVIPGHEPLEPAGIPKAVIGLLFDRTFGILAYSPIYALLPAAAVLAWRANRGRVLRIAALATLLIVQATAHFDWWGGGSTPARLIVTAVPFAALGFFELARAARAHRAVAWLVGVLLVVSLDDALAYSRSYSRLEHGMHAQSAFGYRPVLSFPRLVLPPADAGVRTAPLVGYWLGLIVAVNAFALVALSRPAAGAHGSPASPAAGARRSSAFAVAAPLVALVGVSAVYTLPAGLGGETWSAGLLPDATHMRVALLDAIVRHPFGWVVGAGHGAIDPVPLRTEALTVTYGLTGEPSIEPLKGIVVDDDAPGAGSRERAEPRPALRVPAEVPANTRIARLDLGPTVGGPHSLEIHLRLAGGLREHGDDDLVEVRVLDDRAHTEIARRVVKTSELGKRRYRAVRLDFDLPHETAAVVRLTKLGTSEIWLEKLTLRHG